MGHVWDEDLEEYNNPLPRWWSWLFYITVVFALGYLAVYPGLGSYKGAFDWTSNGQYEGEMQQAEAQYAPIFAKFSEQDVKAVAADPEAKKMGERLFLTYCAQCHGSDARGAKGFPNLTDKDWLWGGEPEQIKTSILEGRQGVMPPHAQLGAETGQGSGPLRAFALARQAGPRQRPCRAWQGGLRHGRLCRLATGPTPRACRRWARPT